jgi:hypothetical protein
MGHRCAACHLFEMVDVRFGWKRPIWNDLPL